MDPWSDVLRKYGPITLIALLLVWSMTMGVSGNIAEIKDKLIDHIAQSNFYLHAICINAAKNESERANCIPPTR